MTSHPPFRWRPRRPTLALLGCTALLGAGCAGDPGADTGTATDPSLAADRADLVFLAQNRQPDVVMEALYTGRVTIDAGGCLRLEGTEPATVVWPYGFTADARTGALTIRDAHGRSVGRIGEAFQLGGGFVPALHEGIPLSAADRARAEDACPGEFWIVGSVPAL